MAAGSERKEIIVVWNSSPLTRYPLSTAISADGGKTWSKPRIVAQTEALQVSYPGITQASDGTFVAVWQQALKDKTAGIFAGRDSRGNGSWVNETRLCVAGAGFKAKIFARHRGGRPPMTLPVLMARGRENGPTLLVTAGVHGDEYEGVRTIFEVFDSLDASTMKGNFRCGAGMNPPRSGIFRVRARWMV